MRVLLITSIVFFVLSCIQKSEDIISSGTIKHNNSSFNDSTPALYLGTSNFVNYLKTSYQLNGSQSIISQIQTNLSPEDLSEELKRRRFEIKGKLISCKPNSDSSIYLMSFIESRVSTDTLVHYQILKTSKGYQWKI